MVRCHFHYGKLEKNTCGAYDSLNKEYFPLMRCYVYISNAFNHFMLNAWVKKAARFKYLELITVKVFCKTLLPSYLYKKLI